MEQTLNEDSHFYIAKYENHSPTCTSSKPSPLKDHLRSVVRQYFYPGIRINNDLLNMISNKIGISISLDRLRDTIRAIQKDIRPNDTWELLPSLARKTIESGGLVFYKYKKGQQQLSMWQFYQNIGKYICRQSVSTKL